MHHGPDGKISGLEVRSRFGPQESAQLTDKPLPAEREGISLPVEILERYAGQYELAPGMVMAVRLKGEGLVAQPAGKKSLFCRDRDALR
jgi:hypothetical protein